MVRPFFAFALLVGSVTLACDRQQLWAQDGQSESQAEDQPSVEEAKKEFEKHFEVWKEAIKELRRIQNRYIGTPPDETDAVQKQWDEKVAETEKMIPALRAAALKYYVVAPNTRRDITMFLIKLLGDDVVRDHFEEGADLAQVLLQNKCDNPRFFRDAGIAFFADHQFELSEQCLKQAANSNALMPPAADDEDKLNTRLVQLAVGLLGDVGEYKQLWEQEQEILKKEAESDDLPRVKFTTNKGDIIFELFENEAPETVGNFIKLVEDGFYDGLTFHRVLPGFMAQGGCPNGDGSGGPGYEIYDEFKKEDRRNHFRGYLSMAKKTAPNSGGSQFFITFLPTPHLNGYHAAFGRVLEGMDVVLSLQRRDPSEENAPAADTIIKAEVVRKRDHEYLPHKVD